jgi:hypothetical protein
MPTYQTISTEPLISAANRDLNSNETHSHSSGSSSLVEEDSTSSLLGTTAHNSSSSSASVPSLSGHHTSESISAAADAAVASASSLFSGISDACSSAYRQLPSASRLPYYIPIVRWLPSYSRAQLGGDLTAGFTVGIMLVAQGIAYAPLARRPTRNGLFCAFFPLLIYCLFGTSRSVWGLGMVTQQKFENQLTAFQKRFSPHL